MGRNSMLGEDIDQEELSKLSGGNYVMGRDKPTDLAVHQELRGGKVFEIFVVHNNVRDLHGYGYGLDFKVPVTCVTHGFMGIGWSSSTHRSI